MRAWWACGLWRLETKAPAECGPGRRETFPATDGPQLSSGSRTQKRLSEIAAQQEASAARTRPHAAAIGNISRPTFHTDPLKCSLDGRGVESSRWNRTAAAERALLSGWARMEKRAAQEKSGRGFAHALSPHGLGDQREIPSLSSHVDLGLETPPQSQSPPLGPPRSPGLLSPVPCKILIK